MIDYENLTELKVLMIGNSFCFYYLDELMNLAKEAGINLTLARVYESGCTLQKYVTRGTSQTYMFKVCNASNESQWAQTNVYETKSLAYCLNYTDWDVVSFQQHFPSAKSHDYAAALATCEPYAEQFFSTIRSFCPTSKIYFHHIWSYQVGYPVTTATSSDAAVTDSAYQAVCSENLRKIADYYGEKLGIDVVPSGDAWTIARASVGDILCQADKYHDGETGGQYLNACVWFETLFHRDCRGMKYSPAYSTPLSAARITALQNAAHEAVSARYGVSYYVD